MRVPNHMPLASLNLSKTEERQFHAMWVENLEEWSSLIIAVEQELDLTPFARITEVAKEHAAYNTVLARKVHRPRGLGCIVEEDNPETSQDTAIEQGRAAQGYYPPAVRLMETLPPIGDQGERETSVAFAVVALREYLLPQKERLSEQFLYWACKQLDGLHGEGTYIASAFTALEQFGVCKHSLWPYNKKKGQTAGQGPPPEGALDDARQYTLPCPTLLKPASVHQYKSILAGDKGHTGKPIVTGVKLFPSIGAGEIQRTGKIMGPVPGEKPLGFLACCLVGYVDDSTVPGGGYFIVRHSWGEDWAKESMESPGYALMSYAYAQAYIHEAYTASPGEEQNKGDDDYIEILQKEGREELKGVPQTGRMLKKGTKVLVDVHRKDAFRQYTDKNLVAFKNRDYTWLDESRQKVWFPQFFSVEAQKAIERTAEAKGAFIRTLQANAKGLQDHKYFAARGTKGIGKMLSRGREVKVQHWPSVEQAINEEWLQGIRGDSAIPNGLYWPDTWLKVLTDSNEINLYMITMGRRTGHMIVAFLTPILKEKGDSIQLKPLQTQYISRLENLYQEYIQTNSLWTPDFVLLTIGCMEFTGSPSVTSHCSHVLLSRRSGEDGDWQTTMPEKNKSLQPLFEFCKPETWSQKKKRIQDCIEEMFLLGGTITVQRVSTELGMDGDLVLYLFQELKRDNKRSYDLYKAEAGEFAIKKRGF